MFPRMQSFLPNKNFNAQSVYARWPTFNNLDVSSTNYIEDYQLQVLSSINPQTVFTRPSPLGDRTSSSKQDISGQAFIEAADFILSTTNYYRQIKD